MWCPKLTKFLSLCKTSVNLTCDHFQFHSRQDTSRVSRGQGQGVIVVFLLKHLNLVSYAASFVKPLNLGVFTKIYKREYRTTVFTTFYWKRLRRKYWIWKLRFKEAGTRHLNEYWYSDPEFTRSTQKLLRHLQLFMSSNIQSRGSCHIKREQFWFPHLQVVEDVVKMRFSLESPPMRFSPTDFLSQSRTGKESRTGARYEIWKRRHKDWRCDVKRLFRCQE